jgi:outer membrane protein TolC
MMFLLLAHTASAESFTLEEALRRARSASEDVEVAESAVDAARGDTATARSGLLPSVSANASYSHMFASEYETRFEDMGGADAFGDIFAQADTWRAGVSLTQPIWSGGRTRAQMKLATSGRELAAVGLESARASVTLAAAQAWYDAALADRLVEIASEALAQAETTLSHAQLAHEVGRQPEFELLRARVEVENQRVVVIQQQRVRALAHLILAQMLDTGDDVSLAGELDATQDVAAVAASVAEVREGRRIVVLQAEEAVRLAESTLAVTRSQGYPNVYGVADLGFVQYPDSPVPDERWHTNVTAGLGLSAPLFQGGSVRGQITSAQADVRSARSRLEQVLELADLDARDAESARDAADAQWRATAGSVEQAERAYAIAELRFQEGLSTQSELTDARLLLERAQANRAQAARDLQLARIRLALLPALPLSAS